MTIEEKSTTSAIDKLGAYNFQVWHALFELVQNANDLNCLVSVEGIDDVALEEGDVLKLEQLKKTTSSHNPLSNSSVDFWKSIYNWVKFVQNYKEDIKTRKCVFKLVVNSNRKIEAGDIPKSFEEAKTNSDAEKALKNAIKILEENDYKIKDNEYVSFCFDEINKEDVLFVVSRFQISKFEKNYRECFYSAFYYQDIVNINSDVCNMILGWIHKKVYECADNNIPPVFSVRQYKKELNNAIDKVCASETMKILSKKISSSDSKKVYKSGAVFVEQLNKIEIGESDILGSVSNFLRTKNEMAKHAEKGEVLDYDVFANSIEEKWSAIRNHVIDDSISLNEVEKGRNIFNDTILGIDKIKINRFVTPEFFNKGYAHIMADDLKIGWHPRYKELFSNNEENE